MRAFPTLDSDPHSQAVAVCGRNTREKGRGARLYYIIIHMTVKSEPSVRRPQAISWEGLVAKRWFITWRGDRVGS